MPLPTPVIAPLAIAYIQAHGPQTAALLSKALGFSVCTVTKALMNAADAGQLVARREIRPLGGLRLHYELPKPIAYPRFTPGEYLGYRPTGTAPEHVWRAEL